MLVIWNTKGRSCDMKEWFPVLSPVCVEGGKELESNAFQTHAEKPVIHLPRQTHNIKEEISLCIIGDCIQAEHWARMLPYQMSTQVAQWTGRHCIGLRQVTVIKSGPWMLCGTGTPPCESFPLAMIRVSNLNTSAAILAHWIRRITERFGHWREREQSRYFLKEALANLE